MENNVVSLTKQLIRIPSYVGKTVNEKKVAEFIFTFLKEKTYNPKKQFIDKDRFNVIAIKGNPKLWLCAHMDTVEPKEKSELIPKIHNGNIYGLGSVDMKGGLAAILCAITQQKPQNIGLLFYCDEEYNFLGMKKFLENFNDKPALVMIPESTNLQISNAHRGLIEVKAVIKGKAGHASRPEEGVNAIAQTVSAIQAMAKELEENYSDDAVGITTCTLSRIQGGLQIGIEKGIIVYATGTNSIPNTAEIWIDIRPAVTHLRGNQIKKLLKKYISKFGCALEQIFITQDLGALITPKANLQKVEEIMEENLGGIKYLSSKKMGYGDGQLFFEKTGSPVIYFGPGPSETCHKSGEYVRISELKKTATVLREVLIHYGK